MAVIKRSTQSAPKCMNPGRVTRNPYLNFLRDFRKQNCGLSAVETVKMGAKKWKSMSAKDRCQYIAMAHTAPKVARRSRLRARRMRGGRMSGSSLRARRMRSSRMRASRPRASRTRGSRPRASRRSRR